MTATYDLERDMRPLLAGRVELPNAKEFVGDVAAALFDAGAAHHGHALVGGRTLWNCLFGLDGGQGGQLFGSGTVFWKAWEDGAYRVRAITFAICEHTPQSDPGANPRRGWHPAHCSKCGLDMTVDSGD